MTTEAAEAPVKKRRGRPPGSTTGSAAANAHRGRSPGAISAATASALTTFPRVSVLADAEAFAVSGAIQAHERTCLLRLKPAWADVFGQSNDNWQLRCHFVSDRIAVTQADGFAPLLGVLFDLPNVIESLSAPAVGDRSQYIKVGESSQALVQLDPEDPEDRWFFNSLPPKLHSYLQRLSEAIKKKAFDAGSLEKPPRSEALDIATLFKEEHAWTLWPDGLAPPLAGIRVRRGRIDPANAAINLTASQTVECVEEIVNRLLAADDASAGVRVKQGDAVVYENGLFVHEAVLRSFGTTPKEAVEEDEEEDEDVDMEEAVEVEEEEEEVVDEQEPSKLDQMIRLLAESDDEAAP